MSNKKICPLCESDQILEEKRSETISDHYGGHEVVSLSYDLCNECGMDGDFLNVNDPIIRESLDRQRAEIAKTILQEFAANGANFAGMERALELPQRALSKWKNGVTTPAAIGITFLKFLRIFPWLVDVADNNFTVNAPLIAHIKKSLERSFPSTYITEDYDKVTSLIIDAEYTVIASDDKVHYRVGQGSHQRLSARPAWS